MKVSIKPPVLFIAVSGSIFLLGTYLLTTKTSLHPNFFITTCGEVLKNVREHTYFNPDGVAYPLVLITATISIGLSLWQLVRFFAAHQRLHQLKPIENIPGKLQWVVRKHDLKETSISIIGGSKQTAYTTGLFKPHIVISQRSVQKLSKEQLEAVILHELYHLKNYHVLWLLFSRLVSSMFFFIPLMAYLARELRTEFELAADAFVVENQKTQDHLRDSLALNLQYADEAIPHFSTSPIEKRVASLVGDEIPFEQIGIKPLAVSVFSLALMLTIAFTTPNQAIAGFASESDSVCSVIKGCTTADCSGNESKDAHNYLSLIPDSFPFTSSH